MGNIARFGKELMAQRFEVLDLLPNTQAGAAFPDLAPDSQNQSALSHHSVPISLSLLPALFAMVD